MQEHHDIYVQSNTLLQEDLFENFAINALKDMTLILPTFLYFLILPKIRMQTCLKKTEVELGLVSLTDVHMLLMVEESI